jgi:hypothetical protein
MVLKAAGVSGSLSHWAMLTATCALALSSCGGNASGPQNETGGAEASANGRADGSSVLGGGGAGGSAAGTGGESGGADGATCDPPTTRCVSTCATKTPTASFLECIGGQLQCTGGYTRADQCPPDSCAINVRCCDTRTGQFVDRACGSTGRAEACPAGSSPATVDCVPAEAQASTCSALQGRSCSFVGETCTAGRPCSTSCECAEVDGGLVWSCASLLC